MVIEACKDFLEPQKMALDCRGGKVKAKLVYKEEICVLIMTLHQEKMYSLLYVVCKISK